ncbi:TPA: bifunctional isocitrate dehydrogenase kinase/phosphatase [Proteus mirabilis]|uniref:bifunctional isocitrate dehydrogenase kinase/phosphatase n=1 Tax=Proteus mirabilis TaxID=584 RepID=UPI001B9424CD|nr:bifunctional isocitrate dehydrogenase kinase/phosphatase [Proteus mirabilis]ELA7210170.1 bifunctional isocitrate dehydrogenase kinase/phosphatase [Proteus mirabilis]WGY28531.1 bifunctional isocitrate dehydrogenase kinase/phosphatase [Proteus mirabilis]HBC6574269.1 bifunctional isocitrate dehydrogenase kinase/phosphatase [Proteus mirabilis]HCR4080799.1 bifunctional isocitrate dehydrogenase kinase/phosphatase [Proteus mirabilis]HEK0669149.1 bifunctional isocitrate dehydrogenase kinase/phospha
MTAEDLVAQTILQGFDAQYGRFLEITSGAQYRFEQADWHGIQLAMKERIRLYDNHVGLVVEQLRCIRHDIDKESVFLQKVKERYTQLLPNYPRFEIAESFFNSVYCRLFHHRELNKKNLFVFSSQPAYRFAQAPRPLSRTFVIQSDLPALLQDILSRLPLRLPWQNKSRDIQFICQTLYAQFSHEELQNAVFHIANELFYRNKAAWMIGKIAINNQFIPLLLPIHNIEQHLVIDTCLTTTDEASIVFGFARSYFMVYAPFPAALVTWLRDILPEKSIAELYMSIGCQKHGKTEYYREYLAFMNFSSEQFIEAPGVKGMVMLVFTLPTYDRVFKVIKDRFAPQKTMTAERVKECYRLVKEHDRVGRMADTQEFENFVIDKKRISNDLMAILEQEIPNKLEDLGDKLLISHLYMERRMTPLNIYMEQCDNKQLKAVVEDYGQALKELIAANIFPGDMLFKNFGVTRHHRVIFYDYDEISYMTDMNFRAIPPARYPEDELASEPWYSVAENDVFPEEFRYFLCCDKQVCHYFEAQHRDLLSPEYWQQQQQRIKQGYIEDVYAYPQSKRFIDNDIG